MPHDGSTTRKIGHQPVGATAVTLGDAPVWYLTLADGNFAVFAPGTRPYIAALRQLRRICAPEKVVPQLRRLRRQYPDGQTPDMRPGYHRQPR